MAGAIAKAATAAPSSAERNVEIALMDITQASLWLTHLSDPVRIRICMLFHSYHDLSVPAAKFCAIPARQMLRKVRIFA
jgi:hypothetical protein